MHDISDHKVIKNFKIKRVGKYELTGRKTFILSTNRVEGSMPEWLMGADCKSAGFRLRWFKSSSAQNESARTPNYYDLL